MSIPKFDKHGLLPQGVHDCTLMEIGNLLAGNSHRQDLFENLIHCIRNEIRPLFNEPIYINGSFVTDKEHPDDIDIILELRNTSDARKWQGLEFMKNHQSRLLREYQIDFWINLPSLGNDFAAFFQYIGVKTARFKGLNPKHFKGILRLVQ